MLSHAEKMNLSIANNNRNYAGQIVPDEWKILIHRSKNPSVLEDSNWKIALKRLGVEELVFAEEKDNVRIERFGSWAIGWFEYLFVKEGTEQFKIAEKIDKSLRGYPILDEQDYSDACVEVAEDFWTNGLDDMQRLEHIRTHRSDFDFKDFGDMMATARGEYFGGDYMDMAEN